MSKHNSFSEKKQVRAHEQEPDGTMPLVRGMEEQEVLLANGQNRKLLVLNEDQEKYTGFSMVFHSQEGFAVDLTALGLFYQLAVAVSDHYNVCRITAEEFADLTGRSKPTVLNALNCLIEAQYIRRIAPGVYMLSPYRTMQLRKRYFKILAEAWKSRNISSIREKINRLDAEAKERTERNRRLVQDAGVSVVPEAITLPDAEELPIEERKQYATRVKRGERMAKAVEKMLKKEKKAV